MSKDKYRIKPKKKRKFRLLLDSAFAKPLMFPHLKKKSNLAHTVHTYNLSPRSSDQDIYNLGNKEKRLIVTIDNDFKQLVKKNKSGAIIIEAELSNKEIDELLTEFISGKNPENYKGKITKLKK